MFGAHAVRLSGFISSSMTKPKIEIKYCAAAEKSFLSHSGSDIGDANSAIVRSSV